MKRDDEIIRRMLFEFESSEDFIIFDSVTDGSTDEERKKFYHLQLMKDSGFVTHLGQHTARLTSEGHDFLEAIRDEGIWKQTKSAISETGGSVTLEIFKTLATGFLKKKIEKHTGIEL